MAFHSSPPAGHPAPSGSTVAPATGSRPPSGPPSLDLRLSFALDGLGALYALLATGIGVLVVAYGTAYLSLHLAHQQRPVAER